MKNRGTKRLTLAALIVCVVGLTIGFAAFTTTLTINPGATVSPGEESVVFDNKVGFKAGSQTGGTIAEDYAKEWTDIKAEFTTVGQVKTFTATIINDSEYSAYVTINNLTDTYVESCTSDGTEALWSKACSEFKVDVSIDKTIISKGGTAVATVTITGPTTPVDGTVTAEFKDITIDLSTAPGASTGGSTEEPTVATWSLKSDADGDGEISTGDIITYKFGDGTQVGDQISIGEENFYVISNDGENIQMLTEYNIDTTTYRQSSTADPIAFSSTNYWTSNVTSYPAYVYDSNSLLEPVVEGYVSYLNSNGVSGATGKLISYEQLEDLECSGSSYSCENAPTWVYSSSYWTGLAHTLTMCGSFALTATSAAVATMSTTTPLEFVQL